MQEGNGTLGKRAFSIVPSVFIYPSGPAIKNQLGVLITASNFWMSERWKFTGTGM